MSAPPRVLYLAGPGYPSDVFAERRPDGWEFERLADATDRDEIRAKLADADFAILSSVAKVAPDDLGAGSRLRVLARQGVGVDSLDLDGFARRGVRVTICPVGSTEYVAEHTLMLMLAAGRHLVEVLADVRERGLWPKTAYRAVSYGLYGTPVAVVGYGRIGRAVVDLLLAFGADVTVVSRSAGQVSPSHAGVRLTTSLPEALESARFVTLHTPLTEQTHHLIGEAELRAMPQGGFVVNTGRGGLVDERALLAALDAGHLAGAALDVVAHEPPAADDPLRSHPRVILTPHHAAGTRDSLVAKADSIYGNLRGVWQGLDPQDVVN